jgi:hypothetical protein
LKGSGIAVQFSKDGDYRAAGRVFEIGGPGKTKRQLRKSKEGMLVLDGINSAAPGELPLFSFGFLW